MNNDDIIKAAANLGVLGGRSTAAQTLRLLTNPSVSLTEVAASIEQEPTMASRVLRVANSAYYSLNREISTIENAAVMMGLDVLRAIAAAACFDAAVMQCKDLEAGSIESLRMHCIGASVAAESIAKLHDPKLAPIAFMGGLLHDLGILIKLSLSAGVEQDYEVTQSVDGAPSPSHEHCAAVTFEVWGLPEVLVAAARHHHHPEAAPPAQQAIAATVHLGDALATSAGLSFSLDGEAGPDSHNFALARLGLQDQQLEEISETLKERVDQLTKALSG